MDEILSPKHMYTLKDDYYMCIYKLSQAWGSPDKKAKLRKPKYFDRWLGTNVAKNFMQ